MKHLYGLLLILLVMTSCVSPTKYTTFLTGDPEEIKIASDRTDWLEVTLADSITSQEQVVSRKSSFVPALVYWDWNTTLECEIDPVTSMEYLTGVMQHTADSLGLREKVAGGTLHVEITQLPGQFYYVNRGYLIFALVAYSTMALEEINPLPRDLFAAYTLERNGQRTAWGSATVDNQELPMSNQWKSTKKFTWKYLDAHREELNRMGRELIMEIDREL